MGDELEPTTVVVAEPVVETPKEIAPDQRLATLKKERDEARAEAVLARKTSKLVSSGFDQELADIFASRLSDKDEEQVAQIEKWKGLVAPKAAPPPPPQIVPVPQAPGKVDPALALSPMKRLAASLTAAVKGK